MLAGSIEGHVFDAIMSTDIDTQAHHAKLPSHAISKLADALPGLGIVAAVLGVVLTMGKLNEPPEVLGHSIGAALLGTFLGVLMCYGFVGPMAANLDHQAKSEASLLQVAKEAILGIAQDLPPVIAVDAGRRALAEGRPSMEEMEEAFKRVPK